MDNRKFWKTVKLLYPDKIQAASKIALLENEVLLSNDKEVAEIFNEYFVNIPDSLGIIQPKDVLQHIDVFHNPVEFAFKKCSSHQSVKLIYSSIMPSHTFAFNFVSTKRDPQSSIIKIKESLPYRRKLE